MKINDRCACLFSKRNSKTYIKYLKKKGVAIGKGTVFFSPISTQVDTQRPYMVEIGEYCKITSGVTILQHDYSRSVLRRKYGEILGESQKTTIGNNVFIGINTIVLMGSKIGDNVIIGAGSIVHGTIPDNCVVAGSPAKIIKPLDEYYAARKKRTAEEAKETFLEYKKKYNREPSIKEMGAFWQLFLPKDIAELKKNDIFTKLNGDSEDEIIDYWLKNVKPRFGSYEEFKKWVYREQKATKDKTQAQ